MAITVSANHVSILEVSDGMDEVCTLIRPLFGRFDEQAKTPVLDAKIHIEEGDGGNVLVIVTQYGTISLFEGKNILLSLS